MSEAETDVIGRNHKRYTSMTIQSVAGISSNGAVVRSTRKLELTPNKDLVVNKLPVLPLKVSMQEAATPASERMERMKKKNLDRFATVSQNLRLKAEEEKFKMLDKIKKEKKKIKAVTNRYQQERSLLEYDVKANHTKEWRASMIKKQLD